MAKVKSFGGDITVPEFKVTFQMTFNEKDLPGDEGQKPSDFVAQITHISPELKEILVDGLKYLEKRATKWGEQAPPT